MSDCAMPGQAFAIRNNKTGLIRSRDPLASRNAQRRKRRASGTKLPSVTVKEEKQEGVAKNTKATFSLRRVLLLRGLGSETRAHEKLVEKKEGGREFLKRGMKRKRDRDRETTGDTVGRKQGRE